MSQPTCNPACQQKIILNGGRVRSEIQNAIDVMVVNPYMQDDGHELIAILDEAEAKLMAFNEKMLKKAGYKGKGLHCPNCTQRT